jgi:hypothetical protein
MTFHASRFVLRLALDPIRSHATLRFFVVPPLSVVELINQSIIVRAKKKTKIGAPRALRLAIARQKELLEAKLIDSRSTGGESAKPNCHCHSFFFLLCL